MIPYERAGETESYANIFPMCLSPDAATCQKLQAVTTAESASAYGSEIHTVERHDYIKSRQRLRFCES